MAGFDFSFQQHPNGESLQRVLLRWSQRIATDLGLELRYAARNGHYWVRVDGPLPLMHVLRDYLATDFVPIAASFPVPQRKAQRMQIAERLLAPFIDGVEDMTAALHEIARELGGMPNSILFDPGRRTHLVAELRALTTILVLHRQGRISLRTVVEEVHTLLERLLRLRLDRRQRNSTFDEMVEAAVTAGALTEEEGDHIRRLKTIRRVSKHRGQNPTEAEVQPLIELSTAAIHKLLSQLG